ncbi:response regulator transcription factor [Flagellimonas olearia]|uniref:Regulator n=1 Tax=Flagellimonas olearia TaxID=552546 RepID=A0A444VM21_9FLAO|nr:response regulator transcription factor [Allomuricauda olearia]RYC51779.1 regulator [Allomuricauda olearia]
MHNSHTLLIADDHPLLLKGLVDELGSKGYNVIAQATNGLEALEALADQQPDIAILDIQMPMLSGIEVIAKAREVGCETRFILLTSHKEEGLVYRAKQLGISGYLMKEEPFSEIQKCIQMVSVGSTYFSKSFEQVVETTINPQLQKLKLLSSSERTILRMMAQSKTSKEIAGELLISLRTVQKHRSNMIQKLELGSDGDQWTSWISKYKDLILSL